MVILTMSPSIVEALKRVQLAPEPSSAESTQNTENENERESESNHSSEPCLNDAAVGKPISHSQILRIWQQLETQPSERSGQANVGTLEQLLVGSRVYVAPPQPRPEPSDEYKALMARLRRDEEARAYSRMVQPTPPPHLASHLTSAFAEIHRPVHPAYKSGGADDEADDVTYHDVHRQVMLILNFVLTMAGVAYALWVLARWWPTPSRLFLAMGGSLLFGLAEYGLYAGYVWHLAQAKKKEQTTPEVKRLVQTWEVGGAGSGRGEEDDGGKAATPKQQQASLPASSSADPWQKTRGDAALRKRQSKATGP